MFHQLWYLMWMHGHQGHQIALRGRHFVGQGHRIVLRSRHFLGQGQRWMQQHGRNGVQQLRGHRFGR